MDPLDVLQHYILEVYLCSSCCVRYQLNRFHRYQTQTSLLHGTKTSKAYWGYVALNAYWCRSLSSSPGRRLSH